MVVFLDTSAIYALANQSDPNHRSATQLFRAALEAGIDFLVHNYIILESLALLQTRGGWRAVNRFLSAPYPLRVRWVDEALHRAALRQFMDRRGKFSLVDEVSFLVMQEAAVAQALAFDRHFIDRGFSLYRGS